MAEEQRDEAGRFLPGTAAGPGRPSIYEDEYAELAHEAMASGLSKTAAAGVIGIARSTFAEWEHDHPGFSEAVKLGETARVLFLEQDLLEAQDGPHVTSRIFALKNAAPDEWRDKVVTEHTGKVQTEDVTPLDRIRSRLSGLAAAESSGGDSGEPE